MRFRKVCFVLLVFVACASLESRAAEFRGRVVDAESGELIPARVYLRNEAGEWLFVQSAAEEGSALPYREEWVPMPESVELHTTISAHAFRIELPAGKYTLEVERGKEYVPVRQEFEVSDEPVERTIKLPRWINLSARGWYSGETHVHRRIHELPSVMLAEDLNVAFPVTFWTVRSDAVPDLEPSTLRRQGPSPFGPRVDRGYEPIFVDPQHVIFPRNTEYEIFSVGERRHVLGALFVLNHQSVFRQTAPPVRPIVKQARAENALLDLDKHSWPWSLMLVPVAEVDLFELSNNSVWRTEFGFKRAPANPPPWVELERESPNELSEWGWLTYGFEMYYALLNCGFRMTPTAGTASGVHPVPLGYSRVYVHTGEEFDPQKWLAGLKSGRSFVTTGPMLFATIDGKLAGETFRFDDKESHTVELGVESISEKPIERIEILVNGDVVQSHRPQQEQMEGNAWRTTLRETLSIDESSWIAVRSVETRSDGRKRFSHTAPWYVQLGNKPVTPRRVQVRYFVDLLEAEVRRNRDVLPPAALDEFESALSTYRELLSTAR